MKNFNVETQTFTTTARDGVTLVLIVVLWMGRVTEVNVYRASGMLQIESVTLKSNGGK